MALRLPATRDRLPGRAPVVHGDGPQRHHRLCGHGRFLLPGGNGAGHRDGGDARHARTRCARLQPGLAGPRHLLRSDVRGGRGDAPSIHRRMCEALGAADGPLPVPQRRAGPGRGHPLRLHALLRHASGAVQGAGRGARCADDHAPVVGVRKRSRFRKPFTAAAPSSTWPTSACWARTSPWSI